MLKHLLPFALAIPLCGHCQSYANSPFYKAASSVPSTAGAEGWSQGSIKANGIVIALSVSSPSSSPDLDEIRGIQIESDVNGSKPSQTFHFYLQYNHLNITFGYELLVEPVEGTDQIRVLLAPSPIPTQIGTGTRTFPSLLSQRI
jgi:hypothetical protein